MGKLFDELKRRKVIKVGVVYAVVAGLVIQVAATVFPPLQVPDWTVSFVTILFILGFPIAVVLAWAVEAAEAAEVQVGLVDDYHALGLLSLFLGSFSERELNFVELLSTP